MRRFVLHRLSVNVPCSAWRILLAVSWLLAEPGSARAELRFYPPPGDLAGCAHLRANKDYTVRVNGKPCFVYETEDYWDRSTEARPDKVAFVLFSFKDQPVTVDITCAFPAKAVTVRPTSFGIRARRRRNRITLTLARPRKISVEVNNRKRPLFIFADAPDEPDTEAHHYFGPGVHRIGPKYKLGADERLYIAGGAVLEGTLLMNGPNIKVRGRGILNAGHVTAERWRKDKRLSILSGAGRCDKLEISGLCLMNSPGWFTASLSGDNAILRNLKVIGWLGLTDGPSMYGSHTIHEDCFVFCNDDVLKLNVKSHWVVRNHVIWKGPYGRVFGSLAGGKTPAENITVENIDVICDEGGVNDRSAVFAIYRIHAKNKRKRGNKKNCTFRNIRVEGPRKAPFIYFDARGFEVRNFTFENIRLADHNEYEGRIRAAGDGLIDGLHFKSVTLGGTRIRDLAEANVAVTGAVHNITF